MFAKRIVHELGACLIVSVATLTMGGCPLVNQNQNPTANGGNDQSVGSGDSVTLNGTGSDPDGDTLTFSWSQVAGANTVALGNAGAATTSFTAPNATDTLQFQLTVNDGQGGTDTDSVTVNVTLQNQNPIANAGNDQSVGFGDNVTLSGAASSDPDGDTLTFSWSQVGGANTVALSNAAAATTSFTAPNSADTLQFALTVDDGQGGTGTDSVTINVTDTTPPPPPPAPVLLIANFDGNNVVGYDISNPQAVNGNIAPDANLAGANTFLDRPSDIVVDAGGSLLVSNFDFGVGSVTSYTNANDLSGINGNVAPNRNVQGAATLLIQPTTLVVNTTTDLVFVADINTDQIFVYGNASTAAFNGNLAPLRTITSTDINDPFGINFGANDELYVANNGGTIAVFANASNLNGNVAATRIITSAVFTNLFDVFVDSSDTMYAVDPNGFIYTFNNASTLNGAVNPDFTLQVQGAGTLTAIAVDSAGNGYIVDNTNDAVLGYDNIGTRNGLLAPDRTLQGAATQLNGPIRVFLLE